MAARVKHFGLYGQLPIATPSVARVMQGNGQRIVHVRILIFKAVLIVAFSVKSPEYNA